LNSNAVIITGDPDEIQWLVGASGRKAVVVPV
jgi:hypothetical protein